MQESKYTYIRSLIDVSTSFDEQQNYQQVALLSGPEESCGPMLLITSHIDEN